MRWYHKTKRWKLHSATHCWSLSRWKMGDGDLSKGVHSFVWFDAPLLGSLLLLGEGLSGSCIKERLVETPANFHCLFLGPIRVLISERTESGNADRNTGEDTKGWGGVLKSYQTLRRLLRGKGGASFFSWSALVRWRFEGCCNCAEWREWYIFNSRFLNRETNWFGAHKC